MSPADFSADELTARIIDVLSIDENLLKKAVCIYALRECSYRLTDELGAGLGEQLTRRPAGDAGDGSADRVAMDEQKMAARVRSLIDEKIDLKAAADCLSGGAELK